MNKLGIILSVIVNAVLITNLVRYELKLKKERAARKRVR